MPLYSVLSYRVPRMYVLSKRNRIHSLIVALALVALAIPQQQLAACPFCDAVSQTLRIEMAAMDAVVIGSALQDDSQRDTETGKVRMKVESVLKGGDLVKAGDEIDAIYYGEVEVGRRFMLSGVDPPQMQWTCFPVSPRVESYVTKIAELPDDDQARLKFFHKFLQDEEAILARDAYDEFALAPYAAVKGLEPEMDHAKLIEWIRDPEMPTNNRRLYLTMLGICGDEKDLPLLEEMLRSTTKSSRGGLDALIGCYLTLAGEEGLPLINELLLANKKASYADTYQAIMAIRFHGTEGDVIPRSALVESLHHVLERKDLADLVIPDLARWNDWSQIDRLVQLFIDADADNNWVRVPVVNYLRACPLDQAKAALKKVEEVDPESVRRANTFFSIPVPARETGSSSSSIIRDADDQAVVAIPTAGSMGPPTADAMPLPPAPAMPVAQSMNPWRLAYVLGLALCTLMIAQFLLLSGGPHPKPE